MASTTIAEAIRTAQGLIEHLEGMKELALTDEIGPASRRFSQATRLDSLIEAARASIDSIESSFLEIKQARNARASFINQLPLETLIMILDLSLGRYENLGRAQSLLSVCHYWKQIFDNTPSLWTPIENREPPVLVRKAIKLSARLPLNFHYSSNFYYKDSRGKHTTYPVASFWNDVLPGMDRCHSLTTSISTLSDIEPLVGCHAPSLERLFIHGSLPWSEDQVGADNREVIDIFGPNAPNLKIVNLTGVMWISWQSDMFTGLETLGFQHMGRSGPRIAELMNILRRSPAVKHLHIDLGDQDVWVPPEDTRPLELHSLTSLRIAQDHTVPDVLSRIRTPNCNSFSGIITTIGRPPVSSIAPFVERLLQVVGPRMKITPGVIKIDINSPEYYFTCSVDCPVLEQNQPYEIRIGVPPPMVDDALLSVVESITPHLSNFQVTVDHRDESPDVEARWIRCLSRLPHVTKLSLRKQVAMEPIIRYLSNPVLVDGVEQWSLSNLHELWLGFGIEEYMPNVLQMVRNRYGVAEDSGAMGSPGEAPASLAKLTMLVETYDEGIWDAIQGVVGVEHAKLEVVLGDL